MNLPSNARLAQRQKNNIGSASIMFQLEDILRKELKKNNTTRGKDMTNLKMCDRCGKVIEKKTDYVKLQLIQHQDKRLIYSGVGHLCLDCLKEINGEKKSND
jgi:hypothetical protein